MIFVKLYELLKVSDLGRLQARKILIDVLLEICIWDNDTSVVR